MRERSVPPKGEIASSGTGSERAQGRERLPTGSPGLQRSVPEEAVHREGRCAAPGEASPTKGWRCVPSPQAPVANRAAFSAATSDPRAASGVLVARLCGVLPVRLRARSCACPPRLGSPLSRDETLPGTGPLQRYSNAGISREWFPGCRLPCGGHPGDRLSEGGVVLVVRLRVHRQCPQTLGVPRNPPEPPVIAGQEVAFHVRGYEEPLRGDQLETDR